MDFKGFFIDIFDFELTKEIIGSGSYGEVLIAVKKSNGKRYAAKIIKEQESFDSYRQTLFLRESLILYELQYPSILKFEGISFQSLTNPKEFRPMIITEYLPNKSLKHNLKENKDFTSTQKYITLLGISDAMRYLHKHGIIHRDLKPENILFDENYFPRICDFGMSRSKELFMTPDVGTPVYMAPELMDNEKYNSAVDVYSFGIITYEIVSGKMPYFDIKKLTSFNLFTNVSKGVRPTFIGNETEKMRDLISRCWSQIDVERPSFDEIFNELSTDFSYFKEKIDEKSVNEYINYLASERAKIEEKEKGVNVDDDEEDKKDSFVKKATFIDKNNISYELYENKTAKISDSSKAEGEIVIPGVIEFSSVKYSVTEICKNAFANSKIEILLFSANSLIESIGDSEFENSKIKKICLPKKLSKLDNFWCKGAKELVEVNVDPRNKCFSVKDGFLVRDGTDEYEILFPSETEKLEEVFLEQEKPLKLSDFCFSNSKNLSNVRISCNELETSSCCFSRCSSFKLFEIIKSTSVNLHLETFKECKSLEIISFNYLPVITIKEDHFISCKENLKTISFNEIEEVNVDKNAFKEFNHLEKIIFTNIKKIGFGDNCFYNCQSLSILLLDCEQDIAINENTFCCCTSLKEITLKTKSKLIIPNNFMLDSNQLQTVIMSGGNVEIGDFCFKNCDSLKSFTITESGKIIIGESEFINCTSLLSITIKSDNKSQVIFGNNCFSGAVNLIDFNLEKCEVTINNNCFESCKSLKNLFIIEMSKISIAENQLVGLDSLQNVVLKSKSEINIGQNCFSESPKLETVEFIGSEISIASNCFTQKVDKNDRKPFKISITAQNVELFDNSFHNSNIKEVEINGQTVSLFSECFSACSLLDSLKFDGVKSLNLGSNVFCGCKKFDAFDVNIPELILIITNDCFVGSSIKKFLFNGKKVKIGENSFKSLTSIEYIQISADKIDLKNGSFENCTGIQEIHLNGELKLQIGDTCFSGVKNLKTLELSGNVTKIGKLSFAKCYLIENLEFEFIKVFFGEKAFDGCSSIKSITIKAQTEFHAGPNCFSNLANLNEVNITSENVIIDDSCFSCCSSLNSFSLLDAEKVTFGDKAFESCSSIMKFELNILNELNAGPNCFLNSTKLNEVKITCKNITVGDSCFSCCSSLNSILFLNSEQVSLGSKTFEYCNNIKKFELEVLNEFHAGPNCFSNLTKLNEVKITSENVIIDDSCYSCCSSLNSFSLLKAEKVTFGAKAFESCSSIIKFELNILNELNAGPNCFSNSTKLNEVKITCKNITVGDSGFSGCTSLNSISFLNSEQVNLGSKTFEYCNNIMSFELEELNEFHAGPNCFSNLTSLNKVQITSKKVTIDDSCFSCCSSLKSFTLLKAHQIDLGEKILEYCNNITYLDLDAAVEFYARPYCFSNLHLLNMVQITGEKVTIDDFCFANCSLLHSFSIMKAKQAFLKEHVFENCEKFDYIDVQASELFEASKFCFYSKLKKFKEFSISSKKICISKQCFEFCPYLKQINCQSANQIDYFDTQFNGVAPNEFFKCQATTKLKKIAVDDDVEKRDEGMTKKLTGFLKIFKGSET